MRVTWFVIFLQIGCEKKLFLIQTEKDNLENSSKSPSEGKAKEKIDTINVNSHNKSKDLEIVKRTKKKGKDYWSDEEYDDDHPYYDEYDEDHNYGNGHNFDNSYGNGHNFDNSYGNGHNVDNSYGYDQGHFDNLFHDDIGRSRCGRNSRRGRNHQYELQLNEALHIECGHGSCIGSVKFSSCRTRNKFERSSHSERACIGKESCCLKARDHLRRPGFHCNRQGNREKVKIKYRCDGKGFDLTEIVRAGHRTCNQRQRQVQSTTTTTPTTTIPTTTPPPTTRRPVIRTTRRYVAPTRRWTPRPVTVRSCVWIFCWG